MFLGPRAEDVYADLDASKDLLVAVLRAGAGRDHHPAVGTLDLEHADFTRPGDPDISLVTDTATPGSSSADGLTLLGSWPQTQKADTKSPRPRAEPIRHNRPGRSAPRLTRLSVRREPRLRRRRLATHSERLTVNPTYDFSGQVALVTGASSGMGLATARAYAQSGAAVVLTDINQTALHTATQELANQGHHVLAVVCDVADEASVADAVAAGVEAFGRLDHAFNNAGIQVPPCDAADEPAEIFDRVNAVNLRGVWACMKHELAQMRIQGSGAIVSNSSLGGLVGLPGRAAYHATKHGVIGLTKSAALEYAPRGVRINAICPGTIATPMVTDMIANGELDPDFAEAHQPIHRLGTAEEIAATVLWLTSPGAGFVTGVALPVDGGYTAQ